MDDGKNCNLLVKKDAGSWKKGVIEACKMY
jgi:hypothetical protein